MPAKANVNGKAKTQSKTLPDRFDEFWSVYPRKDNRADAARAFAKATTATDADVIIAGAVRYRDDPNREAAFTAHGATWLNRGSWDNPPLPARDQRSAKQQRVTERRHDPLGSAR